MRFVQPLLVASVVAAAVLLGAVREPDRRASVQADDPPSLFDPTVVRDVRLRFDTANWEAALAALPDGRDLAADLTVDGVTLPDVGVRYKGNSSSNIRDRKKPFNVTVDAFVPGQKLYGYDTFNLNNGFVDPTLVREVLTYGALRPFMPTPGAAHVRLHVNGAYFGLYAIVQQIEGTYVSEWFAPDDGILFKGDPPDAVEAPAPEPAPAGRGEAAAAHAPQARGDPAPGAPRTSEVEQVRRGSPDLRWLGEDLAAYRQAYDLKTDEAGDTAYAALRELTRALDAPVSEGGPTDAAFPAAIQRVLDVDGALWYIAAHNLFTNFDSYYSGHNYYLFRSEADGRFHILSWDMNESFGVFRVPGVDPADSRTLVTVDPFFMSTGQPSVNRPLLRRLLAVPDFRADYLAHYRTLLAEAFAPDRLESAVTTLQDRIRDDVRRDPNLLYGFDLFGRNVWEDVRVGDPTRGRAVPGVLKLAVARHDHLAGRPDLAAPDHRLADHVRTPDVPTDTETARVTLTFDGTDAPTAVTLVVAADGGMPAAVPMTPTAGHWSATIPRHPVGTKVRYYARAVLPDGRTAFHPAANQTRSWTYTIRGVALPVAAGGDLVLNELLADNTAGITDPAGEHDDWLELYNRGDEAIELAGYFLSDDPLDPRAYALPDVTLDPRCYYLVWCDHDPDQGVDHADFRLSKDGDQVLLSTDAATVDAVTFAAQEPDVSYGRSRDGLESWTTCRSPSPRRANTCGGVSAFLPWAWR